jgi:hypothetical protein
VHQFLQDYYTKLSDLTIVARSSRKAIGKALELEFETNQMKASSYLILCLCFKEYCHATNLAVRLFKTSEFETISDYYNRLATEHPDRQLLIFSGHEVKPILERVGAGIRSSVCGTEDLGHTTLQRER